MADVSTTRISLFRWSLSTLIPKNTLYKYDITTLRNSSLRRINRGDKIAGIKQMIRELTGLQAEDLLLPDMHLACI